MRSCLFVLAPFVLGIMHRTFSRARRLRRKRKKAIQETFHRSVRTTRPYSNGKSGLGLYFDFLRGTMHVLCTERTSMRVVARECMYILVYEFEYSVREPRLLLSGVTISPQIIQTCDYPAFVTASVYRTHRNHAGRLTTHPLFGILANISFIYAQ